MSSGLLSAVKVLYVVTKPCWDYFTYQTTEVRTPKAGLKQTLQLAEGWASDEHLAATFEHSLYNADSLRFMGIPDAGHTLSADLEAQVTRAGELALAIVGERS